MNDGCVTTGTLSHSVMSDSCDPVYYSPPGSSAHGIFQASILEWVAISSSRGSSQPGTEPASPAAPAAPELADGFVTTTTSLPGKPLSHQPSQPSKVS